MNRVIFSFLLAVGVALTALGVFWSMHWSHAVLLAAMIGITSYPLWHSLVIDKHVDVGEPIYLFVGLYAFFYISRPIYIIYTGETVSLHRFYLDPETVSLALLASALGLFAVVIGYYWGRRRRLRASYTDFQEIDVTKARWLAGSFIVVGIAAYLYVIFVLGGGLESTFNTERTSRYYIIAKNPYVANLTVLVGVGLLILCFVELIKRGPGLRWRLLFLAVISYGALDIAFSGSRRVLVNIVFALLLHRHYVWRRLSMRQTLAWVVLLVVFSASWLYVRSTMHEGTEAVRTRLSDVQTAQAFDDINTQGDNAIFDYLVAVINTVPMAYDYNYGMGLARFVYFPIPRAVWPDKPENLSRVMTQRYDPMAYMNGGSAGASMVGEFYMEFGWFGIAPLAILLGYLLGLSYSWLLANLRTRVAILIYSCCAFSFIGAIVRGGLFGAMTELAMMVLPILMVLKLSKRRLTARRDWITTPRSASVEVR